jgi:hypothetical protein
MVARTANLGRSHVVAVWPRPEAAVSGSQEWWTRPSPCGGRYWDRTSDLPCEGGTRTVERQANQPNPEVGQRIPPIVVLPPLRSLSVVSRTPAWDPSGLTLPGSRPVEGTVGNRRRMAASAGRECASTGVPSQSLDALVWGAHSDVPTDDSPTLPLRRVHDTPKRPTSSNGPTRSVPARADQALRPGSVFMTSSAASGTLQATECSLLIPSCRVSTRLIGGNSMATEVGEAHVLTEPIVRRKHVRARDYAEM